uniref:AAA+ ATPase domain-containing protein n=1 Tax=viral metagenome TaxID=1070528 RepID=A0A6C0DRA2_9ZZZZ
MKVFALLCTLVLPSYSYLYPGTRSTIINRLRLDNKYPHSPNYYEQYIKRLNSKNVTDRESVLFGNDNQENAITTIDQFMNRINNTIPSNRNNTSNQNQTSAPGTIRIQIGRTLTGGIVIRKYITDKDGVETVDSTTTDNTDSDDDDDDGYDGDDDSDVFRRFSQYNRNNRNSKSKKSDHFEVITNTGLSFKDVGGYENVKSELEQCVDLLQNHTKYQKYNVRVPRGLIFEGPPGNGKTFLAKALAGECKISFIAVSGSEFQDKYVGVGSSKVRELFALANKNAPCIIFIDEIDALGRRRSSDGELSSSERDSTLNELLVAMDGFKNATGVFVVGATNRADLLDTALTRPGRIDKRIFIGNPDTKTREAILRIHLRGKPHDNTISIDEFVEQTNGFSAAQIENLLNEAMLNALKHNKEWFSRSDIDMVMNKIIAGYQANPMEFTEDLIYRICVHEAGHSIVGFLSKFHAKMKKVVINLSSPKSPGYTIFETKNDALYTRESLFEHLVILISGHIAERIVFNASMTTGASDDIQKSISLATSMANMYGMTSHAIYPSASEKFKTMLDDEIFALLNDAYAQAEYILTHSKDLIIESAKILLKNRILTSDELGDLIDKKHGYLYKLDYENKDSD